MLQQNEIRVQLFCNYYGCCLWGHLCDYKFVMKKTEEKNLDYFLFFISLYTLKTLIYFLR